LLPAASAGATARSASERRGVVGVDVTLIVEFSVSR
jgi:hypothetical protein